MASFTRTINVIIFVSSTFDLFDGHFDNQIWCTTHLAHPSVRHYWHNVNLNADGNVTCKQKLMDITAVYLHINNWCNIVKARYDDTNLSYQCCDEQRSDWFTVLRRHLEPHQETV